MTLPHSSTPVPHNGALAATAPDPIITIDEESTILYVNGAAERTFGYAADELVGQSLLILIPERFQARHTAGIQHYISTGERRISWHGLRVAVRTKSGAELPVDMAFGEFEWHGRRVFSGFLRDISERVASDAALAAANAALHDQAVELEEQMEEAQTLSEELAQANEEAETRARLALQSADRARRLLGLSTSLNTAAKASAVADLILDTGMSAVGADAASLALFRDGEHPEFQVIRTRGFAADITAEYSSFELHSGRPLSDAVLSGAPTLIESREEAHKRYPGLAVVGYEGFVALPVLSGGRPIAAIVFSFREPQHFDESMETFLRTVGEQCAQALERARLYDERDRQAERSSFLAEASRVLSSSLDYEATLRSVAESAVPTLADWCAVDVIDDPTEGAWPPRLTRLAVVHKDPAMRALGLSLAERFPTDWNSPGGLAAVLRDGTTEFVPVVTDEMLAHTARGAEHLAVLKDVQISSVIIVPLRARGLTLGALTLVMSDSGRVYGPDDVSLATDLAGRAGVAIDNARLFRAARAARAAAEDATARADYASKAKSNFLATMSHEIRTPINAVMGYAELLGLELAGPLTDEQRTQIERIRASTDHLLALVNEVLDLAKIESGTLRVDVTESLTGDTVNAALGLVSAQASAKGVTISESCEGVCSASYMGDPSRVRQILANLITNAVKFTEPGGSVSVSCAIVDDAPVTEFTRAGKPYVAFCVADTGIGIPADQLDNIFEAFVQAESDDLNPYTRKRSGTGLGLAISRQLANQMAGDITVESEVGVGSTFTLFIPLAGGHDGVAGEQSSPRGDASSAQ